ncbi:MAG: flagellar motor protein MotA, partial [Opitutaceae bacterium]|nr:flagellar motor protein MotA [Opitutaceae bacterium]
MIFVGILIVIASVIGGFMIAGGNPVLLLHVSEFVTILGVAAGVLVIASPMHVLKEIIAKLKDACLGKAASRDEYFELLRM